MSSKPPEHQNVRREIAATPVDFSADNTLEKLRPLLRPEKVDEARIVLTRTMTKFHSGPIPPAEELEHLEHVLPGAANRCFEMAEREQAHRHECDKSIIKKEFTFRSVGQWLGLLALVLLLGIVAYLGYLGDTKSAAALGSATIAAVVLAFTASKYIENIEPAKPAPPTPQAASQNAKRGKNTKR